MIIFVPSMLCPSKTYPFSLGNYLGTSVIIEILMRIRVTSEEWTWLGLEWPLAQYVALGTNYAQEFDLYVDLYSVDVDDVASPEVKLSDAKCPTSLLSSFFLKNSSYFGVNKIIKF